MSNYVVVNFSHCCVFKSDGMWNPCFSLLDDKFCVFCHFNQLYVNVLEIMAEGKCTRRHSLYCVFCTQNKTCCITLRSLLCRVFFVWNFKNLTQESKLSEFSLTRSFFLGVFGPPTPLTHPEELVSIQPRWVLFQLEPEWQQKTGTDFHSIIWEVKRTSWLSRSPWHS